MVANAQQGQYLGGRGKRVILGCNETVSNKQLEGKELLMKISTENILSRLFIRYN